MVKRIGKGAFANVHFKIEFYLLTFSIKVFMVKHKYSKRKYAAKVFLKDIASKEKKGLVKLIKL